MPSTHTTAPAGNKPTRHTTRKALVQSLYAYSFDDNLTSNELFIYINNLVEAGELEPVNQQFFLLTMQGILPKLEIIDEIIARFLDRPLANIDKVSYSIIRLATYEMKFVNLSPGIAINEATELGKDFGMTDSYKYINAILDKIGKS